MLPNVCVPCVLALHSVGSLFFLDGQCNMGHAAAAVSRVWSTKEGVWSLNVDTISSVFSSCSPRDLMPRHVVPAVFTSFWTTLVLDLLCAETATCTWSPMLLPRDQFAIGLIWFRIPFRGRETTQMSTHCCSLFFFRLFVHRTLLELELEKQ